MFNIVTADQNHLGDAANLFNQYRIFYQMPSDLVSATQFIRNRFENHDSIIFIHYLKNSAVGFSQIYPSFSSVAMKPIWVLNDLYVSESVRRKGCATALLQYIDQKACDAGIFSIQLSTAVTNHQAQALYDSLGYKEITQFQHFSKTVKQ